jgi:predicted AlkP superfamily phosphohydrolase/phosphomutase
MLSRNGAQVIVFNPVHTEPPTKLNGVVITDWLVHDAGHYNKSNSYPAQIAQELVARYPDDPVNPNDWGHSAKADPKRLLAAKRETLKRKLQVLSELLETRCWNFCYVGFDECHEMSHLFWHIHDTSHPRNYTLPGEQDPIGAMLTDLDEAVGRLVTLAGDDCAVIIVSIGGIAANYHWSHLVDTILHRIEDPVQHSGDIYKTLRSFWNRLPHTVQRRFFGFRHYLRETMLERDRCRRRAFALPLNERAGAVRINLVGREPNGIVASGPEYHALCHELTEAFEALVCARTGAPLVRSVTRTREVLDGQFIDLLPDLMIEWNVDQPITTATSRRTGVIQREYTDARTGHHINDGFLLIAENGNRLDEPAGTLDLAAVAKALSAYFRSEHAPLGSSLFA